MLDELSGMLMIGTSNELTKDEFEEIEPIDVEEIVIDSLEKDINGYSTKDLPLPQQFNEGNFFYILADDSEEILANNEIIYIKDLKNRIIAFIDNGGGDCSYCQGVRDPNLSENPRYAFINYDFYFF